MDSKVREIRNAYMREWRARNKEKVKEHQDRYWSKKALEDMTLLNIEIDNQHIRKGVK